MTEHGTYSRYSNDDCRCDACKEAARLYQQDYRTRNRAAVNDNQRRYKRRRVERLQALKLHSGCIDCGYRDHPEALDFDHLDGKRFNISHHPGKPWDELLAEIGKCVVRCANCHRVRTAKRRAASQAA